MPFLSRISSTFFGDLINRLGVRPPPPEGFELINTVQPVSIVDQNISVATIQSPGPLLDVPYSNLDFVAPVVGTILADTGAQGAGDYFCRIQVGTDGAQNNVAYTEIARRDATNTVDIWKMFYPFGSGTVLTPQLDIVLRAKLQAGERIVVRVSPTAWAAFMIGRANIWLSLL